MQTDLRPTVPQPPEPRKPRRLANVRDHAAPETSVSVRLEQAGAMAVLVVADDGPGVTAEEAARAFDRFWQADGDSSASRGHRGTGLGLSIVAEIVAAHGGDIRLETAPGTGATFTITLPVRG